MKKRIKREIDEFLISGLYSPFHKRHHVFDRHVNKTHDELVYRVKRIIPKDGDLVIMSAFLSHNADEITAAIHACLLDNIDKITEWAKHPSQMGEFVYDCKTVIGEGAVKNTDFAKLHPLSSICVVLKESDFDGRVFQLVTAFPVPNIDETDSIWEEVEAWQEEQLAKKRG